MIGNTFNGVVINVLADGVAPVDAKAFAYTSATMDAMASQITSLTSVYSIVYSGADQTSSWATEMAMFGSRTHMGSASHSV